MEVIAKTNGGVLISATTSELAEILRAVTGSVPDKIEVGQKVPAFDYATTLNKIKALEKDTKFTNLKYAVERFNEFFEELHNTVKSTSSIQV